MGEDILQLWAESGKQGQHLSSSMDKNLKFPLGNGKVEWCLIFWS